ncbi:hypothetical protein GGU11DRAFT_749464 [Lentinula aff. detonsa]|nr:hypothetical protein GGU11DRAFT_749464 [Lentinula aff. detonsa]
MEMDSTANDPLLVNDENPSSLEQHPSQPSLLPDSRSASVLEQPQLNPSHSQSQIVPATHLQPSPVLQRSSHTRTPSACLLQSMEYETNERRAQDEAELWANFILASTIEGGGDIEIPKTYAEAMNSPDDWYPPMLKEITSLQD